MEKMMQRLGFIGSGKVGTALAILLSQRGYDTAFLYGGYGYFDNMNDFMAREFWRFVLVQGEVAKLAATAANYPPMQEPASFNLDAVKRQIDQAMLAEIAQPRAASKDILLSRAAIIRRIRPRLIDGIGMAADGAGCRSRQPAHAAHDQAGPH